MEKSGLVKNPGEQKRFAEKRDFRWEKESTGNVDLQPSFVVRLVN
jgi:hypothetical protein